MKLPELFLERMKGISDFDFNAFEKTYDRPAEAGIRLNPRKENGRELLSDAFGELEGVPWCEYGYYVGDADIRGTHPYHAAGLFYFQEPSAMCAAELLPVREGDLVLDLCAAPGGKTTQLAANKGITLVSNEIIPKRCKVLSENVERMGFGNVIVTNETPERLAAVYKGSFNKIIIDAPCSGEGMFKKEPAAAEAWSPEHVASCALRQRKIIDSAMELLAPGGAVVYSTCTFSEEENEENAAYIERTYPYMKRLKTEKLYPHIVRGEGHFAVLFKDMREEKELSAAGRRDKSADDGFVKLYREFEKKYLNISLDGDFLMFGENLYLKPGGISVDGIKTPRPGLQLGVCKKGRFEPAHALAKYLDGKDFRFSLNTGWEDVLIKKYLRGETLPGEFEGFGAILCDGLPLGFCKGSGGILKNRYPKGLRLY